jgi:hypothetical protein
MAVAVIEDMQVAPFSVLLLLMMFLPILSQKSTLSSALKCTENKL